MALTSGRLPSLRPGRYVLRRDERTLQVGVGVGAPPVCLPDTDPVRTLLHALDPRRPGDPALVDPADLGVRRALARLEAAGHLSPATGARDRATAPGRVRLVARGPGLADRTAAALHAAGVAVTGDHPQATVVVSIGPTGRGVTDDLVQAGLPHLVVSVVEGTWRIGPFVVPGRTACLRCVDAHESATDPRRPLVLEQAARAAQDDPEPLDATTTDLALAWAARDVRAYLGGREPGTWSTTVDLPPPEAPSSAPVVTPRLRHPECGCAWDVLLELP